MDIDELRSAQSRERQASSLQHLRDSFYEEVGEFVRGLRAERERIAERSDHSFPSDDPEVKRLTNEIDTAEEVVEALYERRVGKVVKKASFAAADMNVDDEGLTTEERELFETLVGDIEANRASVLDALTGDAPTAGGTTEDASNGAGPPERAAGAPTPEADAGGEAAGAESPGATGDRAAPTDPDDGEPTYRIGEAGPATSEDLTTRGASDEAPADAPTPDGAQSTAAAPSGTGTDAAREDPPAPDPGVGTDPHAGDDGMDAASAMGTTAEPSDDRHAVPPDDAPPGPDEAQTADAASADASTPSGTPAGTDAGGHAPGEPTDGPATDTGGTGSSGTPAPADTGGERAPDAPSPSEPAGSGTGDGGRSAGSDATDEPASGTVDAADGDGSELTVVRVTADIGEIYGVDDRSYDLSAGDVVSLPAVNAAPLVDGDAAERLRPAVEPEG